MIPSDVIDKNLQKSFTMAVKTRYGISHPVIRKENGVYYLSSYCFTYTQYNSNSFELNRPLWYCLADMETGDIFSTVSCTKEHDFSSAKDDSIFYISNVLNSKKIKFNDISGLLDDARKEFLENPENPDFSVYHQYMENLAMMVPGEFKRFYYELSVPIPTPEFQQTVDYFRINDNSIETINLTREFIITHSVEDEDLQKTNEPAADAVSSTNKEGKTEAFDEDTALIKILEECYDNSSKKYASTVWSPENNLSLLMHDRLQQLMRISKTIKFLDTNQEGKIKFSHPDICNIEKFDSRFDIWQEMQFRCLMKDNFRGHLMITPRKNLFTKCTASEKKNCAFPFCPYIVAAYIQYLVVNNKNRLLDEIKKDGSQYIYGNNIVPPERLFVSREKMDMAYIWIHSGLCGIKQTEDSYIITATVSDEKYANPYNIFSKNPVLLCDSIPKDAVMKGTNKSGRFHVDGSRFFQRELGYILAVYLSRYQGKHTLYPVIMEANNQHVVVHPSDFLYI